MNFHSYQINDIIFFHFPNDILISLEIPLDRKIFWVQEEPGDQDDDNRLWQGLRGQVLWNMMMVIWPLNVYRDEVDCDDNDDDDAHDMITGDDDDNDDDFDNNGPWQGRGRSRGAEAAVRTIGRPRHQEYCLSSGSRYSDLRRTRRMSIMKRM